MTDETPRPETDEEKARREMREELFGDLDEEQAEDTVDSLREKVASLSATLARAQADNLTLHGRADEAKAALARAEKKFDEDKQFAVQKFVGEMLPVIDTLELGLKAIPAAERNTDPKFDKLATGVEKTLAQLSGVFNRFGVREINPLGESFDESRHEAIAVVPAPADVEPDTVVDVAQKGYEISGRIIRAAKVVVGQ